MLTLNWHLTQILEVLMKNKILSVVAILMLATVISSCSVGILLVGTKWTDGLLTYSFEKEGVLNVTGKVLGIEKTVSGSYSSEGNELTYSFKLGMVSYSDTVTVEFSKDTMVWLDKDGNTVNTLQKVDK